MSTTSKTDWRECEYCGGEYRGNKGLRIHQSTAHRDQIKTTVPCNWCGSAVTVNEWDKDGHHYCSRPCGKAWNVYLQRGERHPNYVDGSTRDREFRWVAWAVRSRDGECLKCGRKDSADDGRALHVHHIVPEKEAEDPHEPTNLLSLCGHCHMQLESQPANKQLELCGISSRDELELVSEEAEWLRSVRQSYQVFNEAPDPWPGMFAEVQRIFQERDDPREGSDN